MFSRLGLGSTKIQVPPNHLKEIRFPHPTLVRVLRCQRECRRPVLPSPTSCATQLLRCLPTLGILIGAGGCCFLGVVAGTTVVAPLVAETGLGAEQCHRTHDQTPGRGFCGTARGDAQGQGHDDTLDRGRGDGFGRHDGQQFGRREPQWRGKGAGRGWNTQRQFVPVPEDREFAESSQQRAEKNLQQYQQPQQQTDQGNLKKKRAFCFRCKCSGHVNEACKADLDCIICNKKNSHLSSKCPILKIPKPSASFFGSGK